MHCPGCKLPVFRLGTDGRMRARTSVLVIRKAESGANEAVVETICPSCKIDIVLPLVLGPVLEIRKAEHPRFVVRART